MSRFTILVVDDEPEIREIARVALTQEGYRVLQAADGMEALAVLEDSPAKVDLVLADAVMPRMGGRELAWQLSTRLPGLPVVLTSGILDSAETIQDLDFTPAAFIPKPSDPRLLVQVVRQILEHRLEQEREE